MKYYYDTELYCLFSEDDDTVPISSFAKEINTEVYYQMLQERFEVRQKCSDGSDFCNYPYCDCGKYDDKN